jgi:hypothetical protein
MSTHTPMLPTFEQHSIARLEIDSDELAGFITRARTNGNDLAFLRLFLGGVGNDDSGLRLLFAFKAANDDPVMEWLKFHGIPLGLVGFGNECLIKRLAQEASLRVDANQSNRSTPFR